MRMICRQLACKREHRNWLELYKESVDTKFHNWVCIPAYILARIPARSLAYNLACNLVYNRLYNNKAY